MPTLSPHPWPYEPFSGRSDADREGKNRRNVATYFSLHASDRILHIGAGDNPYPNSLAEDVEQYNDKRHPQLLATVGDPISQYLPPGEAFDRVIAVNVKNFGRQNRDYLWVFELAASVMKPGATITLAALDGNHDSIVWAIGHEYEIGNRGFFKVSPTAAGQFEPATPDIRSLPGSAWQPGTGMVAYSNANAVRVVWEKS